MSFSKNDRVAGKQALRETNLKGRMAESLVYDLLHESGNKVFKLGYENILPVSTIQEAFGKQVRLGEKLRSIPDFFVLNKSNDPYLVEVKFRWSAEGHESDAPRLERLSRLWEEAVVIFVNCSKKPYFRYVTAPFINKNGGLNLKPLDEYPPLRVSENLLEYYNLLVEKYLKPTLTAPLPKDSSVLEHPMQYLRPSK